MYYTKCEEDERTIPITRQQEITDCKDSKNIYNILLAILLDVLFGMVSLDQVTIVNEDYSHS